MRGAYSPSTPIPRSCRWRQRSEPSTFNPGNGDPVEQIRNLLGGKPSDGVHHAIECLGLKQTAEQAFQMLRYGGTATIVGMVPFGMKIELHGYDFLREKRIQGSSMGSNRFRTDMPRLMEFYRRGKLHLDDFVSAHIKLDHRCIAKKNSAKLVPRARMAQPPLLIDSRGTGCWRSTFGSRTQVHRKLLR